MKKVFLFAVIASLLFAVSCDKKEMKPEAKLTKIEQLKEMTGEQGVFVRTTNKSSDLLERLNIQGTVYNYYPDEDNTNDVQTIALIEQDINDVENRIKEINVDKGIAPKYKKGTLTSGPHFIDCASAFSNCLVYSGIIFY